MVAPLYNWGNPGFQNQTPWMRALQGQGAVQAPNAFDRYQGALAQQKQDVGPPTGAQDVETTTDPNQPAATAADAGFTLGQAWYDAPGGADPRISAAPNPSPPGALPAGATQSSGVFGTTYQDPGGGWSPWMIYDGREGYNGQAVDGHYDQTRDTNRWNVNGAPENDRNRVWRWTLDKARAEGWDAGSPENDARLKRAFLDNVARLKRDYQANGFDWGSSAFAGYDRMPGTQTAGGQAAAGQPGGATVAGPNDPLNPYNQATGATGTNSSSGAQQQRVGSGTFNTSTGQTTQAGGLGQFNTNQWDVVLNSARDNPALAAQILRLAQGQTGRVTSRIGKYADNLRGRALQAYLNASGLAGSGIPGMEQGIQGFYNALQGNNLIGFLGNASNGIANADFTGMDDEDIETQLRAAIALRSLGVGAGSSAQLSSALDNILYQQQAQQLADSGMQTAEHNLGTMLPGSLFSRYLGLFNQNK